MNTVLSAFGESNGITARKTLAMSMLLLVIVGVAFGTVRMPFLVAGAVLGMAVLATALVAPLALVALMLMVGPVDLSFMTGGFKALFPGMGGLDMNGIRLLCATAGFLAFIMIEPRAVKAAVGPLGRFWVLFLVYAGASLTISLDTLEGLRFFLKLAYPFLTFLIVIGLADSRERLNLLMKYTLIAAALITLIINPLLVLDGGYRIDAAGIVRFGGVGSGDNPFAFYVMAMLFIAFARFVLRSQPLYLLFSGVLVLWVGLTATRIAALGSVVGMVVIGLLGAAATGNRKVFVGSTIAAVVVGAALLPHVLIRSLGFVPTPAELFTLMRDPVAMYNSINWEGRQLLWAILWAAFVGSPLLGLGLGSSTAVIRDTFPDQTVLVAHNEYIRLGTDTGIIGVGLFATATLVWLWAMVRGSLRGDRVVREYAFPAVAGIISWGIVSLSDNPLDYYTTFTQYIGFMVACAVVAMNTRPADEEPVV